MRHPVGLACLIALSSSCYLEHERVAEASIDASATLDAPSPPDASDCSVGAAATVTFSPPFAMPVDQIRVVLLGIDADPTINGLRMHLDICGGAPPCVVDVIVSNVGDALARVHVPPSSASGTLTTDGRTRAYVHLVDERECATCGGELTVLAGTLEDIPLDPDLRIHADRALCERGCGDRRALTVTGRGASLVVSQGAPVDAPPLLARVASDYLSNCVRCDCAFPDTPATGIVAVATQWFAHGP